MTRHDDIQPPSLATYKKSMLVPEEQHPQRHRFIPASFSFHLLVFALRLSGTNATQKMADGQPGRVSELSHRRAALTSATSSPGQPFCLRSESESSYFLRCRLCHFGSWTYLAMLASLSPLSPRTPRPDRLTPTAFSRYKCFKLVGLHPLCAVTLAAGYVMREYASFNYFYSPQNLIIYIVSQVLIFVCP